MARSRPHLRPTPHHPGLIPQATFASNLQAGRAYAPEPYTGRLTLWVSEATAASCAAALGAWSRLVVGGLLRAFPCRITGDLF
jgi:hypothetical protein